MLSHTFKCYLTLIHKLIDNITIYCKNNNEIICHTLDESTCELLFHYEFNSVNNSNAYT